ncbi:MAG: hypothetical protein JWL97_3476, partial [Gemmatimonadales bacterium]|nr:hypothetical protein [Gemmatimonadales bacterium]
GQVPSQGGTVGASALRPDRVQSAKRAHPVEQVAVSGGGCWELSVGQPAFVTAGDCSGLSA